MKVLNEMPAVGSCAATQCTYNVNKSCRARAITIGHAKSPGCDTFLGAGQHSKEAQRIAGVGACKVTSCIFHDDYECSSESIFVGYATGTQVKCITFKKR